MHRLVVKLQHQSQSVLAGCSDFLVPFFVFLPNFIVYSFSNAGACTVTQKLIMAFSSSMLYSSYLWDGQSYAFPAAKNSVSSKAFINNFCI